MRPVLRCALAAAVALAMQAGATISQADVHAETESGQAAGLITEAAPPKAAARPASVVRLAQQDAYRPYDNTYGTYGSSSANDAYRPEEDRYGTSSGDVYRPPSNGGNDAYRPTYSGGGSYGSDSAYNSGPAPSTQYDRTYRNDDPQGDAYRGRTAPPSGGYGTPYAPPSAEMASRHDRYDAYPERRAPEDYGDNKHYSKNEIIDAGHSFFGSLSQGLASVIEHAFKKAGRPNGYILGEDAGGAFVAGLRYGEGRLYTKDAGSHKVYWQGPSIGYDFGGAGAKTMILVYNLRDPSEVFHRFGGVEGSAYLVGGVSIQFQKYGDVVMAPIRAGVGLRLGANVGYLKYTRTPTWNPF